MSRLVELAKEYHEKATDFAYHGAWMGFLYYWVGYTNDPRLNVILCTIAGSFCGYVWPVSGAFISYYTLGIAFGKNKG